MTPWQGAARARQYDWELSFVWIGADYLPLQVTRGRRGGGMEWGLRRGGERGRIKRNDGVRRFVSSSPFFSVTVYRHYSVNGQGAAETCAALLAGRPRVFAPFNSRGVEMCRGWGGDGKSAGGRGSWGGRGFNHRVYEVVNYDEALSTRLCRPSPIYDISRFPKQMLRCRRGKRGVRTGDYR